MGVKMRQKDGKWYVFINHKGRRKAKCVGDSKRAAEEVKRKLEAKLTLGEVVLQDDKPAPTFRQYAEEWLGTHARLNCKPATHRRYESSLTNHLVPAFGTTVLTDISKEQVRQVAYRLRERLAPKGVTLVLAILRSILQQAVDDEILPSNPVTRIGKHLPKRPAQPAVQALPPEELVHLLTTIQTHRPTYYPLFLTLARTGMRIGEALALQWGDIDWHSQTIHVQCSYSGRSVGTPKNGRTRRVDMSTQLTEVLRQVLTQRRTETLQRPEWSGLPSWVFCSSTGGLLEASALRSRVWVPCLAKAGLRHLRIHDLRHT